MSGLLAYVQDQQQYIGLLLLSHIQLTLLSVAIAVCIGVPLGIYISERERLLRPVMGFANLAQAIPSLALLGFLVPYMGIGAVTAVAMVVLYSLLPILKNTCTGLRNISADTLEAAKGIGMTDMQVLFKVRLPLALPVIMAGIRISSVTAVGLMTIAAYIGAGGLGTLVISGIQTDNPNMILAGAIPACCLALLMDFLMSKVETAVTPVSLRPASKKIAYNILKALGLREYGPTLISCPTCGRTRINLEKLALEVERRLDEIAEPITVAVMGCVVNGPGEAREADIGIAGGIGEGLLFRKGEIIKKVSEDKIVDELFDEIKKILVERKMK